MHGPERAVTVIIPTLALRERTDSLREAIDSILAQRGVRVIPLVVLNGRRHCRELARCLRDDSRLRLIERDEADIPMALLAGRAAVDTPWFAALDDDDLLLPDALATRVRAAEQDPSLAVVVTNGYRRRDGEDLLHVPPECDIDGAPLHALLERNWLLPGSWLCRTEAVGEHLFREMPRYLECTYLATRFASEHRMRWLAEPTVIYREGSPHADSRSHAYVLGQVDALRRILSLPLPDDVRRRLRRHVAAAFHAAADREMRGGSLGDAWRWHLASLAEPGGLRHLAFTRHLVRAAWRR